MEDPGDPTEADVGRFLSMEQLVSWHEQMKKKYPQVFPEDDNPFGEGMDTQHAMNTKLMTFFDGDPAKPMRMEVVGSRMVSEMGMDTPMYVVRPRNQTELAQIALTSAHEEGGWQVGWDVAPPSSKS